MRISDRLYAFLLLLCRNIPLPTTGNFWRTHLTSRAQRLNRWFSPDLQAWLQVGRHCLSSQVKHLKDKGEIALKDTLVSGTRSVEYVFNWEQGVFKAGAASWSKMGGRCSNGKEIKHDHNLNWFCYTFISFFLCINSKERSFVVKRLGETGRHFACVQRKEYSLQFICLPTSPYLLMMSSL